MSKPSQSKLEFLRQNVGRIRTGGKGSRRRNPPRKKDPNHQLVSSLDQLLTKNRAIPMNGATTVNFLANHEDGKTKTIYTFENPNVRFIQNGKMLAIFDAKLKTETNTDENETAPPPDLPDRQPNRHEKRLMQSLLKLNVDMKPMSPHKLYYQGYLELSGQRWNIDQPEVFRFAKNTYVVFGPVTMGMSEQKTTQQSDDSGMTLDNFQNMNFEETAKEVADQMTPDDDDDVPDLVESNEVKPETGVSEHDIEMVIQQAKCTREQAITALQKTGDLVNAIMELS